MRKRKLVLDSRAVEISTSDVILKLLEFLGVLTGSGGVDAEAVKTLCKAYEDAHGVAPATAVEAIAWALNTAADFEGVALTVSSSELRDFLKSLFGQEPQC